VADSTALVRRSLPPGSTGALNAVKTECPAGHPYDQTNTYFRPGGGRACRKCTRERQARRRRAASKRLTTQDQTATIVVDGVVVPSWASPAAQKRLLASIARSDGCWEWTGCLNSDGYGHMQVAGRVRSTHRLAYELIVGPIPQGLVLDHLCRNRACARPDHLEPVTNEENIRRGIWARAAGIGEGGGTTTAGRIRKAPDFKKSTCSRGHPISPKTNYWTPRGVRRCLTCMTVERDRRRKARANGR
jgi:hypothetical protein